MLTPARMIALTAALVALAAGPLALLPHDSARVGDSNEHAPLPPTACPSAETGASGVIATIAGSGLRGSSGDGGPALEATLGSWDRTTGFTGEPVVVDDRGRFYFSDIDGGSVRRIGTDGVITTVAGPSTGASIVTPGGLAFEADGGLLIADPGAGRIWRLDPSGAITSIAGTGTPGGSGDDGPAVDAQVQAGSLVVGPGGKIYLDDINRVRRIDPDGIIHAFAGTGEAGFSGDGESALTAMLGNSPVPGATADDGSVFIGDPGNRRVRKVDPTGIITTAIGSGGVGSAGDGGPATEATLMGSPYGIALAPDGSLYFSDWQANRVRRVDADGIISTVAGGGAPGFTGDCGPATSAGLSYPQGIALHDSALFIVDGGNDRIRVVTP